MIPGLGLITSSIISKGIFIESMIFVTAALFVWAAFVRKPGRKSPRERHHWHLPKPLKADKDNQDGKGFFNARKRRKRRRQERRNPTLAQTGGLPAMRAEEAEQPPTI